MYLEKIKKTTLSLFDDKRCYVKNNEVTFGINNIIHCIFILSPIFSN